MFHIVVGGGNPIIEHNLFSSGPVRSLNGDEFTVVEFEFDESVSAGEQYTVIVDYTLKNAICRGGTYGV